MRLAIYLSLIMVFIPGCSSLDLYGNYSDVRSALDKGAIANEIGPFQDMTPLASAIINGHMKAAKLLIDSGADIAFSPQWIANPNNEKLAKGFFAMRLFTLVKENNLRHSPIKEEIINTLLDPSRYEENARGIFEFIRQEYARAHPGTAVASVTPATEHRRNRDSPQGTVPISAPISVNTPDYHAPSRPDDFAIVVGVEKYAQNLPPAEYAANDAKAVFKHLRALGVPARHIVFLSNERAGKSELVKNLEHWLPLNVKSDSRVYFYFSGHGAPDPTTGDAYLLPFSGDPSDLADTAYPLSKLYAQLSRLKAHKVIAMIDSCFSGAGGRSVIAQGTRPLVNQIKEGVVSPQGKLLVLTASKADQISGVLEDKKHGAFTYYLLKGLNGAALNAQDHVTLHSLYGYLKPQVEDEAHLDSRDQDPQLLPPHSPAEQTNLR